MERWREKAREMFPELTSRFEDEDSPYVVWFELWQAFEAAYEKAPPDESLIRRIYRYSDWCCDQPRGRTAEDDLFTCVAVSFYEHIPLNPKTRQDMPRWFRAEDLERGPAGEPNVFGYHLTGEQLEELKRFLDEEGDRYHPDLW